MMGQRIHTTKYHPIVDTMTDENLAGFLRSIKESVDKKVDSLPSHQDFLNRYCKSSPI